VLIAGADTKVVELRVHGVPGNTPEALVDAVAAVDVAGDGVGRIVRPADRLRRPAPGPVLRTGTGPVPRIIEGYLWGDMTSGGLAKAAWALLLPFSLVNMAQWMLPPMSDRGVLGRALGWSLRALVRLAALTLTMLMITQVAVISLDLIAQQWLDRVDQLSAVRGPIGVLPVIGVTGALHLLSAVDWRVSASARTGFGRQSPLGSRVVADPNAPALHAVHFTAALGIVAVLATGGPFRPAVSGAVTVVWVSSMTLIGLSVLITVLLDAPDEGRWFRPPLRRAMAGAALVVAVAAAVFVPLPGGNHHLAGTDPTVQAVAAVLAAICVVFSLLLIPAALLSRRGWAMLPVTLRPWAGGWMAAPVLVIAGLLGGGFGAGVAITVQQAVRDVPLQLPEGYRYVTLLWGASAVLVAVAAIVGAAVVLMTRRGIGAELTLLHENRPRDAQLAASAWRRAELGHRHLHHLVLGLAVVLSVGAVLSLALQLPDFALPAWAQPLSGLGVTALGALAIGLLRIVYLASNRPDTARHLGVLADLACFWPRDAHPIVPPCYALKVVPEVVARAAQHLADPSTRVVLTGHSQGSVLMAVAAARLLDTLPAADQERVGLVTAGSPLQWAYSRAFPAVLAHSSLAQLSDRLGERWRSLCRGTDPLGGAVTTWGRQVFHGKLLGIGFTGPLPPATRGRNGALVLGNEHWLPDPQAGPVPGRQWHPGVLRHRDYTSDPEWDRAVALAAGLESESDGQGSPFGGPSPCHRDTE